MPEGYFVVLADDEEKVHHTIRLYLERNEVLKELESFYTPLDLLEYLKTTDDPVDVILLDIHFKDSGLSGLDAIPFIREEAPYVPIILLTGMDSEAIREAEGFANTYFIPKPVSSGQLIKMIDFYVGKGEHETREIRELEKRIQEHLEYQTLLEEEVKRVEEDRDKIRDRLEGTDGGKTFESLRKIIDNILKNSEMTDYAIEDLESIYYKQYDIFTHLVNELVQFDRDTLTSPGTNIHKYQGVEDVYSVRLSRKARLFVYKGPSTARKRILRVDLSHDKRAIENWLKTHHKHYADPKPGRGSRKT
ncbi:MAG: response regulator [Deltaproteobacteria bacterium]|nr:response regulator [Deltaproteobacteria bacterium]